MSRKVITRFAPSPTGTLHVGGARTALFNYLFARQNGGEMVLRLEDTDKARSKKEYEDNILDGLNWFGLAWKDFCRQSDRTEIYKKYLEKLLADDMAYISKEPAKEGSGEVEVIRFRNPGKKVTFSDIIRGEVTFDTAELKDFVIAKSKDEPLYHLAVVVDDFEQKISHVIRGEDHLSNTPRQILIQEAIEAPRPIYAHLPLILAPDKSKLSKRKHGQSVSVTYYREEGYLAEALMNFLALLGWNPKTEKEIFTAEELTQEFSLENVQKGGAVFNREKLDWLNKEYLKKIPDIYDLIIAEIKKEIPSSEKCPDRVKRIAPTVLERISKMSDIGRMNREGDFQYYFELPSYEPKKLSWKDTSKETTIKHIIKISEKVSVLPEENFSAEKIKEAIWKYAEQEGRGEVLWPFRYALSGREKSPDPFTLADILGKKETLERLSTAIQMLK
ncbi:MAG: glutamate--tRNA ligase [bacterium]|nr:glutamate--tRNA ligase [bacterium]